MINNFKNVRVLIFGLGLNQGGVGAARFFAKKGAQVRVTDLKTKEVLKPSLEQLKEFSEIEYTLGSHRKEDIEWADLIIKNPAVKQENEFLNYAREKEKKIETDLGIFFQLVNKSQIIGVTGTKGKSTTASLIYEGVKGNNKKAILAGNIGKSVLDCLPLVKNDTLVILEISSFQLEGLIPYKVSPKYAVVTNIYPDHLNVYSNMLEYISAKRLVAQFQTDSDFLFLNKDAAALNNPKFTGALATNIIFYSKDDLPNDFKPTLQGEHNLENYAAALAIIQKFSIPKDKALGAMRKFQGVEFRLQHIKNWNSVKIINDTTATTPDAAIKALQTFPNSILITGGMNKNMPYQNFAKAIDKLAGKVFFLKGDSTDEIKRLMKKQEKIAGTFDNLEELLTQVKSVVLPGDIILFSPGATSFNLFQNEFDRGRQFNQAVERVFG